MGREKTVRTVTGHCAYTGLDISGYEIHAGKTQGPDSARPLLKLENTPEGARTQNGRMEGTYVHGLFSNDAFRKAWIERVSKKTASEFNYEQGLDQTLDDLADQVEQSLHVEKLLSIAARVETAFSG